MKGVRLKSKTAVVPQPAECATQHSAILEQVKGILALSQQSQISLNSKMEAHLEDEPIWQKSVDGKLDEVVGKLTAVMEIKVNGTLPLPGEFPLVTSLRGIHEVIHPVQVKQEFWEKFREYRSAFWVFQMLSSKVIRTVLAITTLLAINTIAKDFGIHLTFDALLKVFGIGG